MDATEAGLQPVPGSKDGAVLIYFVVFIFIGSFFIMELFVGATVTSYNLLNAESAVRIAFAMPASPV